MMEMEFHSFGKWVLLAAIYVMALANCYSILNARRSPGATISWLWAHLTIPFIAVPLYWFIGRVRITDYQSPTTLDKIEYDKFQQCFLNFDRQAHDSEILCEFEKIFGSFGPVFSAQSSHVELLIDGEQTFSEIFRAIEEAQRYIIVQYYIIRSDKLGIELKDILVKKAKQGVKIFLLYDDMGSFWLKKDFIKKLKDAGVVIERFLPVFNFKRPFLVNFRNHRKLVIVDGFVAFTGGLNVGEDYIGSRFNKKKEWRDTHLKLIGPSVRQLEEIFLEDWCFASEIDVRPIIKKMRSEDSVGMCHKAEIYCTKSFPVQVVPSGPRDSTIIGMLVYLQMIRSAKRRIWVATPFFVPDEALQKDLELAVLRGVDVRILIPALGEHSVVHWAGLSYAEQLQKHGIKVFLYEKGFTHQKVVLIDESFSSIGTSNFDNRAMYLNFETSILMFNSDFASRVEQMLMNDFSHSREFHSSEDRWIRKFIQLRQNGARLLAPLL